MINFISRFTVHVITYPCLFETDSKKLKRISKWNPGLSIKFLSLLKIY